MSATCESDEKLLSAWARKRDEDAFQQLVRRHAGLVLGVARRRLETEEGAEEVAQNVFTALAKKAAELHGGGGLAGWLHRAAVLESAAMQRSERRRALRMKHLAARSPDPAEHTSEWISLLDEVVNDLPEPERRIILLHWYESRPFTEVAGCLNISTDAAKKRGQRAVERLSELFRRRNVNATPAMLAAVISLGLIAEAPAALPVRIAGKAIAAVGTSSAGSTLTGLAASVKWGAAAAFVIGLAAPLTIHGTTALFAAKSATPAGKRQPAGMNGALQTRTSIEGETPLQKLARALQRTPAADEAEEAVLAAQALIFSLPASDLPAAKRLLESQPDSTAGEKTEEKVAPALRLATYVESLFARWEELDASAAQREALTFGNRDCRYAAWQGAISRMATQDPLRAVTVSGSAPVPEEDRTAFAEMVISNTWFQSDPAAATEQLRLRDPSGNGPLESPGMVRQWMASDQKACLQWLHNHYPDKVEAVLRGQAWELSLASPQTLTGIALAQSDGLLREDLLQAAFSSWPGRHPAEAARAFSTLPSEAQTESLLRSVAPALAEADPAAARSLAASLPEGPLRNMLDLAAISALATENPQQAAAGALAREPGPARREALRRIAATWLQSDAPAAAAWINSCADLAGCRSELLDTAP